MKNVDFSELISKILDVEYTDAIRIFGTMSDKEKESVLWIIAEKYEMAVYPFILSLLIKNGSIILYNILDDILSCALCYIEGAYQMAAYHMKRQIILYPEDISFKERILELYYIPDVYAERSEYLKYANDILALDSNNAIAIDFIKNKAKGDYGRGVYINALFEEIKYLHFDNAYKMIESYSSERIYKELYMLAEFSKSMVVYIFLEYLLEKKNSIFLNTLAFDILTSVLSHIGGAQQMAAYHACKLIELDAKPEIYYHFVEELRLCHNV
mgnify:CR=1 FL=1